MTFAVPSMLKFSPDPFDTSKWLCMWCPLPLIQIFLYRTNLLFAPQTPIKRWWFSSTKSHFTCQDDETQNNIKIHITEAVAWVQPLLMKMIKWSDCLALSFPSSIFLHTDLKLDLNWDLCNKISVVSSGLYICLFMYVCLCIAHLQ